MVVSIYMVVLLTFLTVGFFISYGAEQGLPPTRAQYRLVIAVSLVPTGLALLALTVGACGVLCALVMSWSLTTALVQGAAAASGRTCRPGPESSSPPRKDPPAMPTLNTALAPAEARSTLPGAIRTTRLPIAGGSAL